MRGKAIERAPQVSLMSPETGLSIGPQFDRGGRFGGDLESLPPSRSILNVRYGVSGGSDFNAVSSSGCEYSGNVNPCAGKFRPYVFGSDGINKNRL